MSLETAARAPGADWRVGRGACGRKSEDIRERLSAHPA